MMDIAALEKNLTDNIKEAQIKLGYDDRPMSLNYMCTSLNSLLCTDLTQEELSAQLASFETEHLGTVVSRPIRDGLCLTISAEGTAYVHSLTGYDFLERLINAVRDHAGMDEVIGIFHEFSADVRIEDGCEDYDKLVYFGDGEPDSYMYCLTEEPCMTGGCHVIYHRFTRSDFEAIFK